MKKFLIILSMFQLTACISNQGAENPIPKTTESVSQDFSDQTKSTRASIADFIFPEVNHEQVVAPPAKVVQQPFCYKTWVTPVCYVEPEGANEQDRLIGDNTPQ